MTIFGVAAKRTRDELARKRMLLSAIRSGEIAPAWPKEEAISGLLQDIAEMEDVLARLSTQDYL